MIRVSLANQKPSTKAGPKDVPLEVVRLSSLMMMMFGIHPLVSPENIWLMMMMFITIIARD